MVGCEQKINPSFSTWPKIEDSIPHGSTLGPLLWGHSKSMFVERGEGGHWKANKNEQGEGGGPSMCVCLLFLKQILAFSKWSFIVILQFFLLIIMAVWNIKQTIMKNNNVQSCQWMECYRFRQPFLLCRTFWSFLCTVHCFFAPFQQKWLLIHWL